MTRSIKSPGRASGSGVRQARRREEERTPGPKKRGRPTLLKDFEPRALRAEKRPIKDQALLSRLRKAVEELSSWLGAEKPPEWLLDGVAIHDGHKIPKPLERELLHFLDSRQRRLDDLTLLELVLEEGRAGEPLSKGSPDKDQHPARGEVPKPRGYARVAERMGDEHGLRKETVDNIEKRYRQLHPDLVAAAEIKAKYAPLLAEAQKNGDLKRLKELEEHMNGELSVHIRLPEFPKRKRKK